MSKVVHTKAKDQVLSDAVRESPVDQGVRRTRRRAVWTVVVVILAVAIWVTWRFGSDRPVDYGRITEHFKYGSIGSEPGGSVMDPVGGLLPPYPVFVALPKVCPDKLPGGYADLGFIFEADRDRPIGVSRRFRLGLDQAGLNCAVCHVGTVRDSPEADPRIVLGMPAHRLELQRFFAFLLDCLTDERFSADNVLGIMEAQGNELGWLDRLVYRYFVIPRAKTEALRLDRRIGILLTDKVTAWGPGRVDTFNPYKAIQFNWNLGQLPPSELIAPSDLPSLWNQKPRDGMWLHWDGNNDSVDERNLSASLGAGVTPVTIDHERLGRVRDWIWTLPPPQYPYPIDQGRAARGEELYRVHCIACHADNRFKEGEVHGSRVGKVEEIEDIDTDPHRLNSYTYLFAANQYSLYPGSKYQFKHFRKTNGYANQPLDGIWARAPYLHNGSVPTLRDLLEPERMRPKRFYRGYDVFDQANVGFVHDVAEEGGTRFFLYDTSLPGNDNGGHRYGLHLPDEDKEAIVEYLKTF